MTNDEILSVLERIASRLCFASEIFRAGAADKKTMKDEARLVKALQPQLRIVIKTLEKKVSESHACGVENGIDPQYVAVLGTPPINSPIDAERAWMVSQHGK